MLIQHFILTRSPYFAEVCMWLRDRGVTVEIHLNRSRFSLESDNSLYTEFLLRYAGVCPIVDPNRDLTTGAVNINAYVNQLMADYAEQAAKQLAKTIDQQVLESFNLPKYK